jgi:lysophospholipase L1-like esterase
VQPQPITYPKWLYSAQYGHVLPPNAVVEHYLPGRWRYTYGINALGFRGPQVAASEAEHTQNIVVLGDSYGFGTGVADGEEFSAVLQRQLGDGFRVINLSVGGYGLTQEIRRYYEFGQLYRPAWVILQFCENDPEDNLLNPVAEVKDGRLVFKDTPLSYSWWRSVAGQSAILQKSQLYNFWRNFLSSRGQSQAGGGAQGDGSAAQGGKPAAPVRPDAGNPAATAPDNPATQYYNRLLDALAQDLSRRRINLLVIAVNGQLQGFPGIRAKLAELEQAGRLRYLEVEDWLRQERHYGSPEGHRWGVKAHAIIGQRLAEHIRGQ